MHGSARHNIAIMLLLALMAFLPVNAQDVTATLTPMVKMVQVGRPFEVELRVRHPENVVVIFPDSAKDFLPYEVESGKPLPTRTNEGVSEDVKMYKMYTWEIDSLQYLQFPVRYLNAAGDTLLQMSNRAAVGFQQVIVEYSDSLKIALHPDVVEIDEPFNITALAVFGGGGLLLLIILVVVLRKPIVNFLKRRKIEREWRRYQKKLAKVPALLTEQEQYITDLNRVWKGYFDRDWRLALGARTTKELQGILPEMTSLTEADREALLEVSPSSDMILYAGREMDRERLQQFHSQVARIMEKEYRRRKEAVEL